VSARFNRNNQILIPVKVNGGRQLWCLLDTGGAVFLYLSPQKAAELGITPSSAGRSAGPIDSDYRPDSRARVTLDVGAMHLLDQELIIKRTSADDGVTYESASCQVLISVPFLSNFRRFGRPRDTLPMSWPGVGQR
jgi:hypothetical protein